MIWYIKRKKQGPQIEGKRHTHTHMQERLNVHRHEHTDSHTYREMY